MKIRSLETFKITLPFRFSFGHSLASRSESQNLIVKITLDNGIIGWGEGVPRDYVTGENIVVAEENVLLKYTPLVMGMKFDEPDQLKSELQSCFTSLGLREKANGASWCALELAMLDACAQYQEIPLHALIGRQVQDRVRYGGVIPFGKKKALSAVLWFYKVYGFKTVKIKVGGADLGDDIEKLKLARSIMGESCIIRVDANCAWDIDQTLRASEAFAPFNVSSFEQPLKADEWDGLQRLSKEIEQDIVVDESLCTLKQAEELARDKVCNAFNVRVSKAGGVLPSAEMVKIARENRIKVHMGAQVGESAILSAAARHFACTNEAFENCEGSANGFLLKSDICAQNLTAGPGGIGNFTFAGKRTGLGLRVNEKRLCTFVESSGNNSELLAVNNTEAASPLSQSTR
mgnify:CR=1 FL=1